LNASGPTYGFVARINTSMNHPPGGGHDQCQDILALTVQGRKGAFILVERYGKRKIGGPYRSLVTLERGIERYGMRMLRD